MCVKQSKKATSSFTSKRRLSGEEAAYNVFRHFSSKIVYWNESIYCTSIDRALKRKFNKESGSLLRPAIPELWRFLYSQLSCFGINKNTNIRKFWTIFCHKISSSTLQKVLKNTVAKVGYFHCLLKTLKHKYCPKFRTCPK